MSEPVAKTALHTPYDYTQGRSLKPRDLFDLIINPKKFFSSDIALGKPLYLFSTLFIIGIALHFSWINTKLLDAARGSFRPLVDIVYTLSLNWVHTFGITLIFSPLSAAALWYLGGWWYKRRLEWSTGKESIALFETDLFSHNARIIYNYSFFILAIPIFLATLIAIPLYENYLQFYVNQPLYPLLYLLFPFWSIFVSFQGVQAACPEIDAKKARLWFLALPALVYGIYFAVLTTSYFTLRETIIL